MADSDARAFTLVIGATGTVGRQVAAQLAARGAPVRAMTRNPEGARLPAGVELMSGDLTQTDTLDRCLADVDAVFLVWTAPRDAADAALERIARRARRIVFLSAPIKTPHPFFQQPNPSRDRTLYLEGLIERSGLAWTFLRPCMFAANARHFWGPQIRAGDVVRWPYLDTQTAPVDERDIGEVAARALCEEGHGGREYVLTGPESLSQREQIATIGRVLGRALRIEEVSPEEAREVFAQWPAAVVDMLCGAWAAAAGQPAWVTPIVEEMTGRPARRFAEWVEEHAGEFLAAEPRRGKNLPDR